MTLLINVGNKQLLQIVILARMLNYFSTHLYNSERIFYKYKDRPSFTSDLVPWLLET